MDQICRWRVRGKWLDPKKEKKHRKELKQKATRKMARYNVTILDMFFLWRGPITKLWQYMKLGLTWKRHAIRPSSFRNEGMRLTPIPTSQLRCFLNSGLKTFVDDFVATDLLESCWISLKSVHLDLHCERSWYTRSNLWIWGCFILSSIFIASIAPASSFCADWWNQLRRDHCKLLRFFQMPTAKRRKVCRVVSSFQSKLVDFGWF